jgi:hypothetical protein
MSTSQDLLREMAALLKQFDVKVKNVEELRGLLGDLPGVTDPEVAVARAVRTVAVTAVSVTLGVAGVATLLLAEAFRFRSDVEPGYLTGALGIIWGVAGLIVLASLAMGFAGLLRRRAVLPREAPARPGGSTSAAPPAAVLPEALPLREEPPAAPERSPRFTLP